MKSILAIFLATLSMSAMSSETDKLTCFISSMTERGVQSGFDASEVSPNLDNMKGGIFGETLNIDLEEIKSHQKRPVTKTFSSERMGSDKLELSVGFWYSRGEFNSYSITLSQKNKKGESLSRVEVTTPNVFNKTTKVRLDGKNKIIETDVECVIQTEEK